MARLLRERIPTRNDVRTVNRSLLLLEQAGFVYRLKYLNLLNDGVGYACGLTDRGVEEFGGKTFDGHAERTLDHELEISYLHVDVDQFCAAQGLELHWQQSNLKRGIHPDAYFSITDPKKEGKNTAHFFLEIERQKVGNIRDGKPSIMRKVERYYHYYNTDECVKEWGFKTFRLIIVQKNDTRRGHLIDSLAKEFNHRMFWCGTESNHTTDFRTPKGDTFSFSDL